MANLMMADHLEPLIEIDPGESAKNILSQLQTQTSGYAVIRKPPGQKVKVPQILGLIDKPALRKMGVAKVEVAVDAPISASIDLKELNQKALAYVIQKVRKQKLPGLLVMEGHQPKGVISRKTLDRFVKRSLSFSVETTQIGAIVWVCDQCDPPYRTERRLVLRPEECPNNAFHGLMQPLEI